MPSDRPRMSAEDPGGREIYDKQTAIPVEKHISMVEICQRDTFFVELIEHRTQLIEKRIIKAGPDLLPQRHGVDPLRGKCIGSESTEEIRKRINVSRSHIGGRLTPNQPSTEGVSNQSASWRIGLDRDPVATEVVEENIGLGAVSPLDPPLRFSFCQALPIQRLPTPGV